MKKSCLFLVCTLLLAVLVSGCRTGNKNAPVQVAVNIMDTQAYQAGKLIAEKFARGMEKSLKTNSIAPWQESMPPQLAQSLTEASFKELQRRFALKYGTFQQVSYLGMLNQGVVHYHLWKLHFLSKPDKNSPAIPREGVMWIRVMQEKGKPTALDYFGYMPF